MAWKTGDEIKLREMIERKADEIIAEQEFFAKCMRARICPECGEDLEMEYDDNHGLDEGTCRPCDKTYMP